MHISQKELAHLQLTNFVEQLREITAITFRPPSKYNILQYAKNHVFLPSHFAVVPGLYSSTRNKWQEEILETISTNNRTVLMLGSQMGKSIIQLCVCVYYVSQKPCAILYVVPGDKLALDFSIGRFTPTIKASKLDHLFRKDEDGSNKADYKQFNGGQIWFRSSGSANNLTAITAKVVLLDEVDKYEPLQNGDPLTLAEQRAHVHGDQATFVYSSTPLIKGDSRIEKLYENSDQRVYQLQCFHCDELFTPDFISMVKWESIGDLPQPDTAKLYCPHCGSGHDDYQRNNSIRKGKWLVQNPGHSIAGFHADVLSSNVALSEAVVKYLKALNNPNDMKAFYNETLGLPYEETGERVDNIEFANRLESYSRDKLPNEILFLTVGCDTQADRVEAVIVGWGKDYESWIVDHVVIHGAPNDNLTWRSLHDELHQEYKRIDGTILKILKIGIDTGGATKEIDGFSQYVTKFCKDYGRFGYLPIKGASTALTQVIQKSNKVWLVDTIQAKGLIYGNLKKTKVGAGYMHFPDTLDDEFFTQLTSEQRIVEKKHGKVKIKYERIAKRRAEILDCVVYALSVRFTLANTIEKSMQYIRQNKKPRNDTIPKDYILDLPALKDINSENIPEKPPEVKQNRYARLFNK